MLVYSYLCRVKNLLFVYILLMMLLCCTTEADRNRMRVGLDSINVLNRTEQPFTVQDVEPYVDFFDRHGNSNDQMLAHYLLGRAYHEHGEAPMALQCYQDAAERADTTAADCDYKQLSRVYGQMADIFYQQGLYRQEMIYNRLAEKYAWQGKDTLAALMYYEQTSLAFERLNQVDSAVIVAEDVAHRYELYGFPSDAAIALGVIIENLIGRGEYEKAKRYLAQYEYKSGFFDSIGNVSSGREIYYHAKGEYYLHTNVIDSAELYFRKELHEGKDFNNQNAGAYGLAMVFQLRHQHDSATKYYQYAYAMNDSMYARQTTSTIKRMQSMYDYTRHQKEAHLANMRVVHVENMMWVCVAIILLILLAGYIVYGQMSRKRQEMETKYLHSLEIISQARQDINMLRESYADNAKLIEEKEKLIYEQKDYLKTLPIEMPLYKRLAVKGQEPTAEEWKLIEEQVFELYPQFHQFLDNHASLLNDKEYKTCILIRAGFKPKSISNMLNVGPSYISNIRTEMLQTLFNIAGTPKDFDSMIKNME